MHGHALLILRIELIILSKCISYFLVAGLLATQRENSDIIKLTKSVNRCAASVAIARLFDKNPPEILK